MCASPSKRCYDHVSGPERGEWRISSSWCCSTENCKKDHGWNGLCEKIANSLSQQAIERDSAGLRV